MLGWYSNRAGHFIYALLTQLQLIYAGLVEMLAEDFVHSSPDRVQGLDGLKALVSLFAGASLMSILGCAVSAPPRSFSY